MDKSIKRLWLYLLVTLGVIAPVLSTEIPPVTLKDFSKGLVTNQDSGDICDTCAQDLDNVDVRRGYIEKRRGSVKNNSTTIGSFVSQPTRFLWEYTDTSNNTYLLAVSSNSLYYSIDGGATFTLLTSTYGITSNSRFQAVNAFGKAYLVDGTTNCIVVSGASVSASTSVPKGATIEFFGERLVVGGVDGSDSTLYMSRYGDAGDWTTDADTDNDAFSTQIRQNDGYKIRCVKRWRNGLMVFKDTSMDMFTLSADGLTFIQTPVSSRIGTTFVETVKATDNTLIWLSRDGVYEYNGTTIRRISENIQPTIENLSQLSALSRGYTQTGQGDFSTGVSTNVSISITPGSIILSTYSHTDTTGDDFGAGFLLSNVTTQTISGALYISTNNANLANNSFETADGGSGAANWSSVDTTGDIAVQERRVALGSSCGSTSISPVDGSWMAALLGTGISATPKIMLISSAGVTLDSISPTVTTDCVANTVTFNTTAYKFSWVRIRLTAVGYESTAYIESDVFFASDVSITIAVTRNSGGDDIAYDFLQNGRDTISSGNFTSQAIDTTLSNPYWLATSATYTLNGHTISFTTEVSTSSSGPWDAGVSWSVGSSPSSANKRFIRYLLAFAITSSGSGLPFVNDLTLAARSGSGRYTSIGIPLTNFSSWGAFLGNASSDGGSQTFEVYTDTDSSMNFSSGVPVVGSFTSSQTITNLSVPSLASANYAFVGSTFSITVGSQAPRMDDFTLVWNEGNPSLFPSGLFYDLDYYLALSVSSPTANDTIFIYDRNTVWTKYTNLPVYTFANYRTFPLIGSNVQGDIIRFQVNDRYTDYDSSAYTSYWTSKDFDLGFPLTEKTAQRYYLTAKRANISNLTFSYGVNRGTLTDTSHSLDDYAGFYRAVVKPTSLTYSKGLQHRFKFSDSTNNGQFQVLGISMRFDLETSP